MPWTVLCTAHGQDGAGRYVAGSYFEDDDRQVVIDWFLANHADCPPEGTAMGFASGSADGVLDLGIIPKRHDLGEHVCDVTCPKHEIVPEPFEGIIRPDA